MNAIQFNQTAAPNANMKLNGVDKMQKVEENEDQETVQATPTKNRDTLELTADAQNYLENGESADAETASKMTSEAAAAASPAAKPAAAPASTPTATEASATASIDTTSADTNAAEIVSDSLSSEEDEEVTSSDLYSYSDSELQDLLTDGTITRAQYNQEIARRSGDSEE